MFAALVAGVRRLEALPIPTLALVHGLCLTAGLEVSLGCDLIWATESASSAWSRRSSASPPAPAARSGWPSAPAPAGRASS